MSGSKLPGFGKMPMWGMSPACDLLESIKKLLPPPEGVDKKEINVLLIGQSDIRHCLRTLTKHSETIKENGIRLNFYVVETSLELIARQMLFWTLALEPLDKIGLHGKTIQFMELFGNILIRPQTKKTLMEIAERLIKVVTEDPDADPLLLKFFDTSNMKYRERDGLVEVFKFWKAFSDPARFDVVKHWDCRLRHYLATRYDARAGIFDWDYHMKLTGKGIGIVGSGEYKNWRNTGIAFQALDYEYSQPNITLFAVASDTPGLQGTRSSYWGDIVTGPFICHGIECDDKSVFAKSNGVLTKKSYDLTFQNLDQIFRTTSNNLNGGREQSTAPLENVTLQFVSFSNWLTFPTQAKYQSFFDVIYFGSGMVHQIVSHFKSIFAKDVVILAENARYALEFRPQQEHMFSAKLIEFARNVGLEMISETAEDFENENIQYEMDKRRSAIIKFVKSEEKHVHNLAAEAEDSANLNATKDIVETVVEDECCGGDTDLIPGQEEQEKKDSQNSVDNVEACTEPK